LQHFYQTVAPAFALLEFKVTFVIMLSTPTTPTTGIGKVAAKSTGTVDVSPVHPLRDGFTYVELTAQKEEIFREDGYLQEVDGR
jgi:hypothetical protein